MFWVGLLVGLLVGLFVGAPLGVLIICLMRMAKR